MTKLTAWEKQERKEFIAELPEGSEMFAMENFTFLFVPTCRGAATVTWSIASVAEPKFRRKVGEYHALNRWACGCALPVPAGTDWTEFATAIVCS